MRLTGRPLTLLYRPVFIAFRFLQSPRGVVSCFNLRFKVAPRLCYSTSGSASPWSGFLLGKCTEIADIASFIQYCGTIQSVARGWVLHTHMVMETKHGSNSYLMSLLVQMYGLCASLQDARKVFAGICKKNVYAWNIMIGIDVKHQDWMEAVCLYQRMQAEGVIPDQYSIVRVISAHEELGDISQGKASHARVVQTELEEDVVLGTALINFYSHVPNSCVGAEHVEMVFQRLREHDIVLCNALIAAYVRQGRNDQAHQCFNNMHQQGFIPNKVTFLSILDACADYAGLTAGRRLHVYVIHSGLGIDLFIVTTLLSMYGKCGSIEEANVLFDEVSERSSVPWNALIAVHAHQEYGKDVLQFLKQMQQEASIPDKVTYRTILCSFSGPLNMSKENYIHACVFCSGLESDIIVGTALFSMYGRCGCLERARKLFDGMLEKDLIAWNAMIALYAQNGHSKEALDILRQMWQAGVLPDKVTLMSSLSACADESIEAAEDLFNKIHDRNVSVWNAMLGACLEHGQSKHVFKIFHRMLWEGTTPDKVTLLTMISACANWSVLIEGMWVHAHILCSQHEQHNPLICGLVHMYNKCGCLAEANSVFELAQEHDSVLFNAIILAFTEQGHDKKALGYWSRLQQEAVIPDEVTCIGTLEACGNQASLQKGKHVHVFVMESQYKSDVVVSTSLFNMYVKCDTWQDANHVFSSMVEHDVFSWTSIIAVYREHGQSEVVLELFHQMQTEGVFADSGIYVNVLASCADEVALTEGKMIHTQIIHNDIEVDVSLRNSVVNMYSKCGCMEMARREFCNSPEHDIVSYNIMIAGCAQHGQGEEALQVYEKMQKQWTTPNEYTFGSVLTACSHVGLVNEGLQCVGAMITDKTCTMVLEIYDCLIDLLGRAGQLEKAEILINGMPIHPSSVSWMTLLGASKVSIDITMGEQVSRHLFELDFTDASPYVALSNLYAAAGKMELSCELDD